MILLAHAMLMRILLLFTVSFVFFQAYFHVETMDLGQAIILLLGMDLGLT